MKVISLEVKDKEKEEEYLPTEMSMKENGLKEIFMVKEL